MHLNLGAGQGLVELLFDMYGLDGLAAAGQAFVKTVQAPQIARVLASSV